MAERITKDGPLKGFVDLSKNDEVVTMEFRDEGLAYNPLEKPDPDITLPPEERPLGGLGIYMVKNLADNDECFVYLSSCIGKSELPSALIKIIKNGALEKKEIKWIYTVTCKNCGCIFECESKDLEWCNLGFFSTAAYTIGGIKCPYGK